MSPYRNRLKTPEEIELDRKRDELAGYQSELAATERQFMVLKADIRLFEQVYEEILGVRIAELEDLEWQLKGLLGETWESPASQPSPGGGAFTAFQHTTDLLDDEPEVPLQQKSLKSIYRDVAKAVHPDLASDERERCRRQELMAVANQAYQSGNRKVLEDILSDWELESEPPEAYDVAMELVRVIRMIARARENIHAVSLQITELKQTDIYRFKLRVDESMADGIDLLAEMAATVELDIARTRKRLYVLRGETAGISHGSYETLPPETRAISFPVESSCGVLYTRNADSVDYRDWQRIGSACGVREVFLDRAVRLDVRGNSELEMRFLDDLKPDDLQALFLYDIDDSALRHLSGLTGLLELYLSNTRITDDGLRSLAALSGLQRLSIYHTGISDQGLRNLASLKGLKWLTCSGTGITEEGLALYRRLVPGCKAVSFKWRYEA